jgi:hypothetical protein
MHNLCIIKETQTHLGKHLVPRGWQRLVSLIMPSIDMEATFTSDKGPGNRHNLSYLFTDIIPLVGFTHQIHKNAEVCSMMFLKQCL